jgi:hypothetical protein
MLRRLPNQLAILDRTQLTVRTRIRGWVRAMGWDLRRLVSAGGWMLCMMAALQEAEVCMRGCITGRGLVLDQALILDLGRGSGLAAVVE